MSRNSSSCESVLEPKATEATLKPYTRHILSIDSGVQSHPKATLKPHQSHTKATPKPHQSHTKATPKPTTQAISKAGGRGNRLFSQGLGHNENCWLSPPQVLAQSTEYTSKPDGSVMVARCRRDASAMLRC